MEKHLKVSAIKDGTVIDHIPTKALFKVIKILKLEKCSQMVTFGNNLDSKAMGTKARKHTRTASGKARCI